MYLTKTHSTPVQVEVSDLNRQAWQLRRADASQALELAQGALAQAGAAGYPAGQLEASRYVNASVRRSRPIRGQTCIRS